MKNQTLGVGSKNITLRVGPVTRGFIGQVQSALLKDYKGLNWSEGMILAVAAQAGLEMMAEKHGLTDSACAVVV